MKKKLLSFFVFACLLTILIPFHASAASSACDIITVNSPPGAIIKTLTSSYGSVTVKVTNDVTSVTVNVTTSAYSTWKLYSDFNCTREIVDKRINLNIGYNTSYVKVTAEDNTTTKLYYFTVDREQISKCCDILDVELPFGVSVATYTITAYVPIDFSSLTLNMRVSKYAAWKLYSDTDCTNEIADKHLNLNTGTNTAYVMVTAQDNATTKKYTLKITRKSSSAFDVTSQLKTLGQPFSKSTYARNVWDMQIFNNRIYLGHGNSSNSSPSSNAGPVPIIYYDPSAGNFVTEDIKRYNSTTQQYEIVNAVDEEQIDIYRVLNGKLYIPGHDSRESWTYGNFYVMDNNIWEKFRTIPKGVHVFDMAYFKDKLFAGLGSSSNTADVLMSEDNGNTWGLVDSILSAARVYSLFEFKDKLYAVYGLNPSNVSKGVGYYSDSSKILCVEEDSEGAIKTSDLTVYGRWIIPGLEEDEYIPMKMIRANEVNNYLLFIAGQVNNDQQWLPKGLFISTSMTSSRKISLPKVNALPMDILVRGNTIYVLAHVKLSNTLYTNIVYKSEDLYTWSELFKFNSDTFARSFEELNGDFYFGLGCNTDYLPASTGRILMVEKSAY